MIHLTLNTGHSSKLPADLVWPETRELLLPIIKSGRGNLPGGGSAYRVELFRQPDSVVFTFFRGPEPLTTNGVALTRAGAETLWPMLERSWLTLGDQMPGMADLARGLPDKPTSEPWLATILWPSLLVGTAQADIGFIGQMGACVGLLVSEMKSP